MTMRYTLSLGYAATVLAAPLTSSAPPSVSIRNGTLTGQTSAAIDTFNGLPFADPPTGSLRLRAPQSLSKEYGHLTLPTTARGCPQQNITFPDPNGLPPGSLNPFLTASSPPTETGEDCLTLDIARPAGTAADAKLPVLFWIYGGGFQLGASASYNASSLVQQSVALNRPVLFVAPNYRLSAFGLLGGRELQEEGNTNLALKDQRLALQWVAENIEAFGGDPGRVIIWGESAGAASVYDHLVINGGDNHYAGKPLFHGGIMNSGGASRFDAVDTPQAQAVFDRVVDAAGCAAAANKPDCLRAVPFETFFNASNANPDFLSYRSLDLSYPPRPDPKDPFFSNSAIGALQEGAYAKVPLIATNLEDEGTVFALAPRNLTTTQHVVDYFASWFVGTPRSLVEKLVGTYPDDPAAGAPFRTGSANNEAYPQFKRVAAIMGDWLFIMSRRQELETMARTQPAWSFQGSYDYGLPVLGTFHSSDVVETFSARPNESVGRTIQSAVINFAHSLNPNGPGVARFWPRWTPETKKLLNISANALEVIDDNFRQESFQVYADNPGAFNA